MDDESLRAGRRVQRFWTWVILLLIGAWTLVWTILFEILA